MRYNITHTKMVIIQKTETYKKKDVVKLELSYLLASCKVAQPL